jgi:hypothetical protein
LSSLRQSARPIALTGLYWILLIKDLNQRSLERPAAAGAPDETAGADARRHHHARRWPHDNDAAVGPAAAIRTTVEAGAATTRRVCGAEARDHASRNDSRRQNILHSFSPIEFSPHANATVIRRAGVSQTPHHLSRSIVFRAERDVNGAVVSYRKARNSAQTACVWRHW